MFSQSKINKLKPAPSSPDDDQVLWENFKGSDRQAFARIYQVHIQALYNYGHNLTKEADLIEDCIQDLFVYLWDSRENLGKTTNIKFYLFKCLRRKIFLKLENRFNDQSLGKSSKARPLMTENSWEQVLILEQVKAEQQAQVTNALLFLTKRQKEAIYLRFYDNLSYPEISAIMALTPKATYNLISKALEVLREYTKIALFELFIFFCS